jgi:hypothetical protein
MNRHRLAYNRATKLLIDHTITRFTPEESADAQAAAIWRKRASIN